MTAAAECVCVCVRVWVRACAYVAEEKTCFSGGSWWPFKEKIICFLLRSNRNPTASPENKQSRKQTQRIKNRHGAGLASEYICHICSTQTETPRAVSELRTMGLVEEIQADWAHNQPIVAAWKTLQKTWAEH